LQAAPVHLRVFLLLCSDLAMRSGTAARIAPKHYDPERGQVSFSTKFGDRLTLPVTQELRNLFACANGPADVPYVVQFNPRANSAVKPKHLANSLSLALRRLRFRLGITKRIIPHDLRRTTAVHVYENTHDLRKVQAVLGHRSLPQTLHYLDHNIMTPALETLEDAKAKPRFDA
jgi:integrase